MSDKENKESLVDGGISMPTKVLIAPIKTIISYQIIEAELKQIESGFDGGVFLNIAIGAASASVSLFATVLATTFQDGSVAMPVLLTLAIVLGVFCVVFFVLYWRTKSESKKVFREIRSRKGGIQLPNLSPTN